MGIPENIKIIRDRYGLSQDQLATIAGVTDKAVSTWENGINEPRMGAIQKIADYFGLKKSNIIEDGGMKEPSAIIDTTEALRDYFLSKTGREPSGEELLRFDNFVDIYIKSLDE